MPAAGISSQLQAVMREVYAPGVADGVKNSTAECTYFGLNGPGMPINVRGKRYQIWLGRQASGGYKSEGGAYPKAGIAKPAAMRVFVTTFALATSYSGRFLTSLKSGDDFIDGTREYKDRDIEAICDNLSQDMFEDGRGIKAIFKADLGGNVAEFYATVASGSTFGVMKVLEEGYYQLIDPVSKDPREDGSGDPVTLQVKVGGLDQTAHTAEFVAGVWSDAVDGDWLVRENSYAQSITGLKRHCNNDSLDYQGQPRGKFKRLRASKHNAGGKKVGFTSLQVGKYKMKARSTAKEKAEVLTSYCMEQAVEALGFPLVRYAGQPKEQDIGMDAFSLDGQRAQSFLYCPADAIFRIHKSNYDWNVMTPLGPVDRDGMTLRMAPTSDNSFSDNWLIFYEMEGDLACKNPRNEAVSENYSIAGLELPCENFD